MELDTAQQEIAVRDTELESVKQQIAEICNSLGKANHKLENFHKLFFKHDKQLETRRGESWRLGRTQKRCC